MTPRGIRNNNPGNIRHNATYQWKGEVGADAQNFIIFDTALHGIRALARDLRNKIRRGLDTITKILVVYAPVEENDTTLYIEMVSRGTGFGPNETLEINAPTLEKLCKAIIKHENGEQPFSDELITEAVQSGLV